MRVYVVLACMAAAMMLDGCERDSAADDYQYDLEPCGFSEPVAARVEVRRTWFHDSFGGTVMAIVEDRPAPTEAQWLQTEGSCRYLKLNGTCVPACDSGEFCAGTNVCVEYGERLDAGDLTITGLPEAVVIEDWNNDGYYWLDGPPENLFDEETVVEATFAGDSFPAVTMTARGVADIDTWPAKDQIPMEQDHETVVSWTAGPDPEACVSLEIKGPSSSHGLPADHVIECSVPDTGELTIPVSLVNTFVDAGGAMDGWCYVVRLSRYTRGVADAEPGPAELWVGSQVWNDPMCIGD